MRSTKSGRFPASLWPGTPIPELEVAAYVPLEVESGFLWWSPSSLPHNARALPLELALRELLELEVEDRVEVLAFAEAYGAITRRWTWMEVNAKNPDPARCTNHLADLAAHLGMAQLLVRHWLAFIDGDDVLEPWDSDLGRWLGRFPVTLDDAWGDWTSFLNSGLGAVHVRAEFTIPWASGVTVGEPHPGLYTGLCVQIYNLAAEGLRPLTCQDVTCRRRFVRQRGGATVGQYRVTGAPELRKYCSPRCARRQGQRNRRATMRNLR